MTSKEEIATRLLATIRAFLKELHRERALESLTLQSALQHDLSIDSLGRVELFHRIEDAFQVSLPTEVMLQAETVADLAKALEKVKTPLSFVRQEHLDRLETQYQPEQAESLVEILFKRAQYEPHRKHLYLEKDSAEKEVVTYGGLLQEAIRVAKGLQALGVEKGETVALMLPTSTDFFFSFMGILLIGAIPVPIYPPFRADKIEEYALRASHILKNAEIRVLITFERAERLSRLLKMFVSSLRTVTTREALVSERKWKKQTIVSNMPALIQYTSGSTSAPKGVLLTHENLLANIRAMGSAIRLSSADVGVSWLPLYHDMGLIGTWLTSFYHANPLVVFSPLAFLSRPERWLWAIHAYRGTVSAAPNFAYELCTKRITEEALEGLDLGSWRFAFNGAEAVNPNTLERFIARFSRYGFKPESLCPVYGLAESSVGLIFPPTRRPPQIDEVARSALTQENVAKPAVSEADKIRFVSCGKPLPQHEVRIVDKAGKPVPERKVGRLQFRGPSSMQGYYRQPQMTSAIFHEGWWDSGDLAYCSEEEIYIVGRKKDVIIKAGRNLYPEEIEEVTGQVNHVRQGCVAAFGVTHHSWGTEKLVIVAESRESSRALRAQLVEAIREQLDAALGILPDEVIIASPGSIPKTSSGKLQRAACKELYSEGKLSKGRLPIEGQMAKLYAKGLWTKTASFFSWGGRVLHSVYSGIVMSILLLVLLLCSVLPYRLFARIAKKGAQIGLWLIGCPVIQEGQLPSQKGPVIYIANHASYLDAVVLLAVLPEGVLFVGKRELMQIPLLRRLFKKLRLLTVDREDFLHSLSASQKIEKKLQEGYSIVLFPEGTFLYTSGLRSFKLGAFQMAVSAQVPLCPLTLVGTRTLFQNDTWLLRRRQIPVIIGECLYPASKDWEAVIALHHEARDFIAKHCKEPVLGN